MQAQTLNEVKRAETRIVVFKAGTTCPRCIGSSRLRNEQGTDVPCDLCQGTGNAIRENRGVVGLYSHDAREIATFEAHARRREIRAKLDRIGRWPGLQFNRLFTITRYKLTGFWPGGSLNGGYSHHNR